MRVNRLVFWLVLALVVAGMTGTQPGQAAAAEQRCNELGTACICSEPFNTSSYVGGPDFFNPADSTTKECSAEPAVSGGAVIRTSRVLGSNDGTALSRLPAGHSVTRFLTADNNHEGTFSAGHGMPVSSSIARLAARWYVYHSPNFAFKTSASSPCQNTKIMEFDHDSRIDYTAGFHTYIYSRFSPSRDCCVVGPGPDPGIGAGEMQGKWWRWEAVLTRRAGPGYRMMFFGKNVTDNTPEITILDLSMDSSVSNLTPPGLMSKMVTNNHRWSPSGSGCAGFRGISHYMMAGWTSDSGQRIGPAVEIERGGGSSGGGGSSDSTPPAAPTSPRIQ
jgi:hypothetical protein